MTVELSANGQVQLRLAERSGRILLAVLVAGAVGTLVVGRVWLACIQPLWFDEAWGLFVATEGDWRTVLRGAPVGVNAPLYYVLLHAWTAIAGPSNFAFRLPGLLAVAAAAIIPSARRVPGLAFEARVAWGLMIFAWWGVDIFLAGRCYGLLLALATLQ